MIQKAQVPAQQVDGEPHLLVRHHLFSLALVSLHLSPAQVPVRMLHSFLKAPCHSPSTAPSSDFYLKRLGGSIYVPCVGGNEQQPTHVSRVHPTLGPTRTTSAAPLLPGVGLSLGNERGTGWRRMRSRAYSPASSPGFVCAPFPETLLL